MGCKICGDEDAHYRVGKRMRLCDSCNMETPVRISREEFDEQYWSYARSIPESVKREFYDDYKTSSLTIEQYIKQTSETLGGESDVEEEG